MATDAITIIQAFTLLARQLAKLPEMALPQYASAAEALYSICKMLLVANENTARWYHRFLNFDFRSPDARSEWRTLMSEYGPWKAGPGYSEMNFRCGDIETVYWREVESKLGSRLLGRLRLPGRQSALQSAQARAAEARRIVSDLGQADAAMVEFIEKQVYARLDRFASAADAAVDDGRLDEAEALRLQFKRSSKSVTRFLERAGTELAALTLEFARLAKVPVTLTDAR